MSGITKFVAAAALLAVPLIQACGEGPLPPPPTGSIAGQVSIESDGADGVTVTLSSGATATTASGGTFRFDDVEAGTYTVTISNFSDDASFSQTSAPATLADDGQVVTINFSGTWIRTSAIMGSVTVEGNGMNGVKVRITGMAESETTTGTTGQYAFTGLRAGNYTIEISGFDDEDVGFGSTSATAEVAVGESKVTNFEGTYLRASGVQGQVSIEGRGLPGVTVTMQGRGENLTATTNGGGQYAFDDLRKGDYSIAISGYDDDEYGFDVTSKSVSVAYGETASVPFEGTALRTAEIRGRVTVEGKALDGVTISLSGKEDKSVVTNAAGRFVFDRLHAGTYAIDISGYDTDEYGFDVTSQSVTVALKETATAEFDGIMLRTAAIEGMVTIKGDGLKDVTVTVAGGPKDEEYEATTNGAGMFDVGDLHAGDYSVTISGYDTKEYGFEVTTKSVSVGLREMAAVAFDGILLRTAGVSGRVSVDGDGMSGLTVTLSGEEDRPGVKTNADGQYAFSGLAAGDYTLTLSGYDADEYEFDASMDVTLELDEADIANFDGRSLRTVAVMGTVSAEGEPLMNVGVTLIKVLGANSGEVLGATMTDEDGGYMFDELLTAVYRIDLGETGDEYDFATKSRMGSVETDDTATWDFDAEIIRTASVGGMVTVDGDGMADVTVMLSGDHGTDEEMETGSDGGYMFEGLRKGGYTVSIENPDNDMYDFPTTSRMVSLAVGQAQMDVSFAGSMLRRASISGQVNIEGDGLEGVTVKLRGEERKDVKTDGNGEYNFPGLVGGDYTVSIENPDGDAYTFEVMSVDVDGLGDEEAEIVDFEGEHTTTASVSGVLFADEVTTDNMHTAGEPMLPFASFPLILQGPGVNDSRIGATDSTGAYSFDSLKTGTYNVVVDLNDKLVATLAAEGYAFSGNTLNLGIRVPPATDVDVDLPFRITKQTIHVGAVMGNAKETGQAVAGVSISLYATAKDADNERNALRSATTGKDGRAKIEFDREDDGDHLVYAKVNRTGHADLEVSDNNVIEIQYEAVDRESEAPAAVRLLNTRANFQWWVKSDAGAEDGDEFLEGWKAVIDGDTVATGADGKATFSGKVAMSALPKTYAVALDKDQTDSVDMKEIWAQSGSLSHRHTGLEHPDSNKAAMNDLGAIRVTWRTQALVVGVYREADDVEGYTDYQSKLPGGDHRPVASVFRDMEVKLLERDGRNRLIPYEYDHDRCTNTNHGKTDDREASFSMKDGLAKVACLPAGDEFTIRLELNKNTDRDDRVMVGVVADELDGDIEAFNADELSVGGSVVGIFGDAAGGKPEVRICLASQGTDDDECATWAYQWKTGTVTGNVGNQKDHRVHLAPRTDNHGADSLSVKSGTNGVYKKVGLQDGEYNIEAFDTRTYRVTDDPATKLVYVYHDETTDDKDTATKYVGTAGVDTAKWSTRRLGLKLMGYIGNDANRDKAMRGAETVEGITVELTRSGFDKMTTKTDDRGFYKFENLETGKYTITPKPAGNFYTVNRGYRTVGTRKLPYTNWSVSAQEYPTLTEGEFALPYWSSYTSRILSESSERVCNDADPPLCGTLYNFGLLYTDGEAVGAVKNLSGSANSIDIRLTDMFTNLETETETNSRGEFSRTRLTEGDYTAEIADAGWAVARMRGTVPDDDGATAGSTSLSGELRGVEDFEDMGTLHVYSTRASDQDLVTRTIPIYGRRQGDDAATYNRADTFDAAWSRAANTETTAIAAGIGTISWQSKSVRLYFGIRDSYLSGDASVEVKVGSKVCPSRSSSHTCELLFNATGSTNEGQDRATTVTVMVIAENGYDDHEYSVVVSRAAPVGNDLTAARIKRYNSRTGEDDDYTVAGTGALTDPFLVQTASGTSAYVRFALEVLGTQRSKNRHCAQSVTVEDAAGEEVDTLANGEDDICSGTRYRLTTSSTPRRYTVNVSSEDGRVKEYHMAVVRQGHAGDATLRSLSLSKAELSPDFDPQETEYTSTVNNDTARTIVRTTPSNSGATVTINDSAQKVDTISLNEGSNTITIVVTSEDESTTETYTVTVTRTGKNDATLATLAPDEGTLEPEFASATEDYDLDVGHDVEEVVFTCTTTDGNATADPDCEDSAGDTLELGDVGSDTELEIEVTAGDGETTKTYTVTVSRAETPADPDPGIVLRDLAGNLIKDGGSLAVTEGTTDTLLVGLTVAPTDGGTGTDSTVTVTPAALDGLTVTTDGAGGSDAYTFTVDDWEDFEDTLFVAAAADADAEANDTLDVTFSFAGDTLTGYHAGDTSTVEVAIPETDTKGVSMSATAVEVVDSSGSRVYTMRLTSEPTASVTIEIDDDEAPDGVTATGQLTFTTGNWAEPQSVTISSIANADTADYDAFDLTHSVAGGGYGGVVSVDDVSVQVMDAQAPAVVIGTTAVTVAEDSTFTYQIRLTRAPDDDETVSVDIVVNTRECTFDIPDGEDLDFTDGDWNTEVTITVTAKNAGTCTIEHDVSSDDTDGEDAVYGDVTDASPIAVTVTENN